MYHKILGIDLAKSVFQLCLLNDNHIIFNKKMTRSRLLDAVRQMESGTLIAMEACSTAHYWESIKIYGSPRFWGFVHIPSKSSLVFIVRVLSIIICKFFMIPDSVNIDF